MKLSFTFTNDDDFDKLLKKFEQQLKELQKTVFQIQNYKFESEVELVEEE